MMYMNEIVKTASVNNGSNLISIHGKQIVPKEYEGVRVVTFKDIDELHERPNGTARKRFNENKKHFIKGEDYFKIKCAEVRPFFGQTPPNGFNPEADIVLITESGYLMIVKSLKDELAWAVQRELVKSYFRSRQLRTELSKTKDDYILQVAYADTIAERAVALNELNNNIIKPLEKKVEEQNKEIEHKEDVIIGLVDDISLAQKRQILNRVVRYGHANYQQRWSILYREFENKYHIDLNRRVQSYNKKNSPKVKSKIDYIDKVMNKIPELYELAAKLFENDVNELISEMYGATNAEITPCVHGANTYSIEKLRKDFT